ncbi:MAG TPA: hypothetical protein VIV11_40260 [Kofleriaceae bacterium]
MGLPALWGIAGVVALLANAIYRLTPYALELAELSLGTVELVALVGWIALNAYSEGYRGFQRMFSPRVVARAQALDADPRPWLVVLAPLYCMGLVHATRKRLIISWVLTLAIVAIVVVVRRLDQPWRGIIDAGVVVGLAWGAISIVYFAARSVAGHTMPVSPDLPPQAAQADQR